MKLLLDSHTALWLMYEPERIPSHLFQMLESPAHTRLLSDVSLLELSIKLTKGTLEYTSNLHSLVTHLDDLAAAPLSITRQHILVSATLPKFHKDPFDRLLVAQAHVEQATLVTNDAILREYDVAVLW